MATRPVLIDADPFIKRKHELADLLKELEKGSTDAVELLVTTMNSTDEEAPLKLRLECAKALLDLQVKVADTVSKDQLTRTIASVKVNGLKRNLELEGKQGPKVDFMTIQEV